jgi:hypothetical protein
MTGVKKSPELTQRCLAAMESPMKRLLLLVAVVVTTLAGAGQSLAAKPAPHHVKPHVVKHRMSKKGAGQARHFRAMHRKFKGRHGKYVRRLHTLVPAGGGAYGSNGCYPPDGSGDGCYPPDGSGECCTPDWPNGSGDGCTPDYPSDGCDDGCTTDYPPDGCDDGCTPDWPDDGCSPTYPDDCCPPG